MKDKCLWKKDKRIWKLEYTITLLVLFAFSLLLIPTSLQSTMQAKFIMRWKDCFNRITYMRDVISKHEKSDLIKSFKRAKNEEEREHIIINLIKPYFRLNEEKYPKHYHPKYMNNKRVKKADFYYFEDIYFTDNKIIVGIKDVDDNKDPMFMMMFDINGILPPNTWGKDIFGAKIYEDRIEALGENLGLEEMRKDCSPEGTGISCSYYYKIGGNFVD